MSQTSKKFNVFSNSGTESRYSPDAVVLRGGDYNNTVDDISDLFTSFSFPNPTGPIGPAGPQGLEGPTGSYGFVWQGTWSATGVYAVNDAVGYNGATYFAHNPVGPSATTPDVDTANWALVAAFGTVGPAGPQGPIGPGLVNGENVKYVLGIGNPYWNGNLLRNTIIQALSATPNGLPKSATNRVTIYVSPGQYAMPGTAAITSQFVDIISLTGNPDVILTNAQFGQTITLQADNCYIRGLNYGSAPLYIYASGTNNLVVEKCISGDFSYNANTLGGTFIDCIAGNNSFAYSGIANGRFINCVAGDVSFGRITNSAAYFKNCRAGNYSFGHKFLSLNGITAGVFEDCVGGLGSFGNTTANYFSQLTGRLIRCRLTSGTFITVTSGGRTYQCIDGNGNVNNQ